jgi:hypothetical protein
MEESNWGGAFPTWNGGTTEEEYSSETSAKAYQTALYYNPEIHNLNQHTSCWPSTQDKIVILDAGS